MYVLPALYSTRNRAAIAKESPRQGERGNDLCAQWVTWGCGRGGRTDRISLFSKGLKGTQKDPVEPPSWGRV